MRATVQTFRYLLTRAGVGDHAAFRCVYTMLAPSMLDIIRRDLPERAQAMHVLRGTFCEVWWMAAFDVRVGAVRRDVPMWVERIARQRGADRRLALDLIARTLPSTEAATMMSGFLDDHDGWTRFQLAVMLDGHDTVAAPARGRGVRRPGARRARRRTRRVGDGVHAMSR
jgi:hypothetical protein